MIIKFLKTTLVLAALLLIGIDNVEAAGFTMSPPPFRIMYMAHPKSGIQTFVSVGLLGFWPYAESGWEFKQVTPTVFHVRTRSSPDKFLKIDISAQEVAEISGGTFSKSGGIERIFKNVKVQDISKEEGQKDLFGFAINFNNTLLEYDMSTGEVTIKSEGFLLADRKDIEVINPEDGVYHMRIRNKVATKSTTDYFTKVDVKRKEVANVQGRFGEQGGQETAWEVNLKLTGPQTASSQSPIHEDLGMEEINKASFRESSWSLAEQELYLDLLKQQQYDILVVPVQVQDFAVDHIERSLMTQYLVRRIETTTGLRVADPVLFERALGRNYRTFKDQRIYRIANAVGAKKLIRIYAGHNRDLTMRLAFTVQDRPKDGIFDTITKYQTITWKDTAFSDEKLPSDVFAGLLSRIMPALSFKEKKKSTPIYYSDLQQIPIPSTPHAMLKTKETSQLAQASYLALLGTISPDRSSSAETFYERSLAMLQDVSTKSDDAVFLKAYSLAMLYRRPAALALLQNPATPEEKALRSYLDGNLALLSEQAQKIKSPIPRIMMQVTLSDLIWFYDGQSARTKGQVIVSEIAGAWKPFLLRRVMEQDVWDVSSVIELKQLLDGAYPIKGYSARDITRGMMAQGDYPAGNDVQINTSVHEHFKKILKAQPELATGRREGKVVPLDYLELADAWAENAVIKNINLTVNVQGLSEEGLSLVGKYEAYYLDYPELAVLKSAALRNLAYEKKGVENKNLLDKVAALSSEACYWSQGQTRTGNRLCNKKQNYYDNDFPRRAFWRTSEQPSKYGDRKEYQFKEMDIAALPTRDTLKRPLPDFILEETKASLRDLELELLYVSMDFNSLKRFYDELITKRMKPAAVSLMERNKYRFIGNSARMEFLAWELEKKGDEKGAVQLYQEMIGIAPNKWSPYYRLGRYYLKQGDVARTVATFKRYPLFERGKDIRDDERVDTVALSHAAYKAADMLYWSGSTQEARPFYELSAGYQTGSGSEMRSEYYLALDDGNYRQAAQHALEEAKRYSSSWSYSQYMRLLHAFGFSQEAESLFFSRDTMEKGLWESVIDGHRIAGRSDKEIKVWLAENGKNKVSWSDAQEYFLAAFLIDREPDPKLADMVDHIDRYVPISPEQQRQQVNRVDSERRILPSFNALIAEIHLLINQKQHEKAYSLLMRWFADPKAVNTQGIFPSLVWSGAKSGKTADMEGVLNNYKEKFGPDYYYWLATAMLKAAGGKNEDAIKAITTAHFHITGDTANWWILPDWYQLIEACELLLEDTGQAAYREQALELARLYQHVSPLDSWGYAVEAKYTKNENDRTRALAITLYLDRRSYHISGFSKEEREKALSWLKKNNPFLQTAQKGSKSEI